MNAFEPAWIADQLETGTALIERFVAATSETRLTTEPPAKGDDAPLGTWTGQRHANHLLAWERGDVLPTLRWLRSGSTGPRPTTAQEPHDASLSLDGILAALTAIRAEEARIIRELPATTFELPFRDGGQSVGWMLAHVIQHNYEHANDIARIALFWDLTERRLAHG